MLSPPSDSVGIGRLPLPTALVWCVVCCLLVTSCWSTGGDDSATARNTANPDPSGLADVERPAARREIRLGLTDWTGGRITLAVAEILIERQLGYPVTPSPVGDYGDMFDALESGELDAVLELWPASLSSVEQDFIDSGRVADLGPLGVEGKVGWFVPRSVLDDDPELASWEGFRRPGVADRFATSESEGRGRFLGTNPSYAQFDEELVQSLGLDFTVVYSGSEAETIAELGAAEAANKPIVLYWWRPTGEIVEFDLVEVALPPRSNECLESVENGAAMHCDYPTEDLFKLASPTLAETDPALFRLLSVLTLTTEDQQAMIHAVEYGGSSILDVAARWVEANEEVWSTWIDQE